MHAPASYQPALVVERLLLAASIGVCASDVPTREMPTCATTSRLAQLHLSQRWMPVCHQWWVKRLARLSNETITLPVAYPSSLRNKPFPNPCLLPLKPFPIPCLLPPRWSSAFRCTITACSPSWPRRGPHSSSPVMSISRLQFGTGASKTTCALDHEFHLPLCSIP